MSMTAILAICILSCDFLLYFFFRYLYSEKPVKRSRRSGLHRHVHGQRPMSSSNSHAVSFPQQQTHLRTGYF